ncbi:PREDICTED: uncharacterized protein LOC106818632 [Priapulus caudatus]|uniref:Uncharacterized protein LOC106818632 n=1 Tax=Priapulus caudatus TaxID=37621 RepID=A0ABM1F2Y7_PRICU|nr:PREDICTED: uncharacterized protein LOC106818632 [Priapulus caudatus]
MLSLSVSFTCNVPVDALPTCRRRPLTSDVTGDEVTVSSEESSLVCDVVAAAWGAADATSVADGVCATTDDEEEASADTTDFTKDAADDGERKGHRKVIIAADNDVAACETTTDDADHNDADAASNDAADDATGDADVNAQRTVVTAASIRQTGSAHVMTLARGASDASTRSAAARCVTRAARVTQRTEEAVGCVTRAVGKTERTEESVEDDNDQENHRPSSLKTNACDAHASMGRKPRETLKPAGGAGGDCVKFAKKQRLVTQQREKEKEKKKKKKIVTFKLEPRSSLFPAEYYTAELRKHLDTADRVHADLTSLPEGEEALATPQATPVNISSLLRRLTNWFISILRTVGLQPTSSERVLVADGTRRFCCCRLIILYVPVCVCVRATCVYACVWLYVTVHARCLCECVSTCMRVRGYM